MNVSFTFMWRHRNVHGSSAWYLQRLSILCKCCQIQDHVVRHDVTSHYPDMSTLYILDHTTWRYSQWDKTLHNVCVPRWRGSGSAWSKTKAESEKRISHTWAYFHSWISTCKRLYIYIYYRLNHWYLTTSHSTHMEFHLKKFGYIHLIRLPVCPLKIGI